ncbi:MAG TPA: LacI family DNA-binding transcriptional regulator [Chloroflexota bacterium]|nr:LacI family DNA-binding transcriptional regulator [Chloroflexota bacterium]
MGRRVRLVDVAAAAGVSKSVASRALADAPDIAQATKARIRGIAKELGYRASWRARSLGRRNGPRPVAAHAALVSLHVAPEVLGASFLGPVLAGILSGAAEEGLELQHIVVRPEDGSPAEALGRLVAEDRADGLILLTFLPLTPADVAPLDQARVPYVLVNRHFGARAANCVTFAWEAAAQDAAQRLVRLGHRHLAMLLPYLDNTSVMGRAAGWQAGIRELGLQERDAPILRYQGAPGVPSEMLAGGFALGQRLLRQGLPGSGAVPTAMVGFNDWCALGVLRAAAELGVRVPEALSVIGFDSTRVGDGTTPPLCSYRPHFIELGRRAAGLLGTALRGELDAPQRIVVPVDFVCRGSCAPPPAGRAP